MSRVLRKTGRVCCTLVTRLFRRMAERYYDPEDYLRWYSPDDK